MSFSLADVTPSPAAPTAELDITFVWEPYSIMWLSSIRPTAQTAFAPDQDPDPQPGLTTPTAV